VVVGLREGGAVVGWWVEDEREKKQWAREREEKGKNKIK